MNSHSQYRDHFQSGHDSDLVACEVVLIYTWFLNKRLDYFKYIPRLQLNLSNPCYRIQFLQLVMHSHQ